MTQILLNIHIPLTTINFRIKLKNFHTRIYSKSQTTDSIQKKKKNEKKKYETE